MQKSKIYLLPGLMCDKRVFKNIYKSLKDEYDLVYLDIPLKSSFKKMCESLYFKEDKINLLGFSMGGYLATYYALQNPNRIDNILIVSSSCCSLSINEIEFRQKAISFVKEFGFKPLSSKKAKSLIENSDDEELIKLIQNMYNSMNEKYFLTQMQASLYRNDLSNEIINSNLHFNFSYSKNDKLLNHDWFEKLKSVSNCSFNTLNSSSHMLTLEKSKFIVDEIRRVF